jgi:hypothetical protein
MSSVAVFMIGVGLTALIAIVVVVYLNPHLKKILIDLCGTTERAGFWTAFSNITLVLVPMIFAIGYRPAPAPPQGFELDSSSVVMELAQQLKWALIGTASSVLILGIVISRFIPKPSSVRPIKQVTAQSA